MNQSLNLRLTTKTALVCCFVVMCLANVAMAQRSAVVIGDSLAKVNKPEPGQLDSPFGVDFDKRGNMYIVELSGGRVHKLDTEGTLTTIAGDGSEGYGGDNGPAKNATFNGMHNVAVTPAGDIYISDSWNHCVRKIDDQNKRIRLYDPKKATLTSILGSGVEKPKRGLLRPHGVCVHENGSIYVVDTGHHRILRLRR